MLERKFDKEEYRKLNLDLHGDNIKALDTMCFVINAIYLLFQTTVLVKITLIAMLLSFMASAIGNDLAIGENYRVSNKIFDITNLVDRIVVLFTIITIIHAF